MPRIASCALLVLLLCSGSGFAGKAPFTLDAMMQIQRIADPQLSPDGKSVAFTVAIVDMPNNSKPTQIYVVPVDGGVPRKLTTEGSSNIRPRWSPDSKRIFFVSDRTSPNQIWSMNGDGLDQRQVTTIPTGGEGVLVSPDGKEIVFTSAVFPECATGNGVPGLVYDAACNTRLLTEERNAKVRPRVYTSLLYRHWTTYQGRARQHLFAQSADGSGSPRDLTPGALEVPPFQVDGLEQYVISPDCTQLVYVSNTDRDLSTSTNSDLFAVPLAGGEAKRLTTNPGADEGPVFSPDGRLLAYRTQTRPGYESDQWRLAVLDLQAGRMNTITDTLDKWVESYTWSPDSKRIFFTVDDHGTQPLMMMAVDGGAVRAIAQGPTSIGDVQFTPDGKTMIYSEQSGSHPVELFRASSTERRGVPLTRLNDDLLQTYELPPFEKITVDTTDGTKIDSFLVKPPDFDANRKYPVLFALHGGPENEWGESWTYRWNAQVFAAAGYVVVLPNPRGSAGYGQAFTDAVNTDWGGKPYDDVMATVDYVSTLPYVDKDREVAAGGSYGGYMVDWILGHTDRFRALVSHAGVYDLRSEAGTTEELWFPKWEFQGFPWENSELYEKWSPSAFVKNFKTPTLVSHGELDYRVPIGQGQQLFTALQEMNVPSKLVQFPDEGHWILKPQNSQFWYQTVIEWFNHYTAPTAHSSSQ